MILTEGGRVIAVGTDNPAAVFAADSIVHDVWETSEAGTDTRPSRACIEILLRTSGHPQRALLGGTLTAGLSRHFSLQILTSGKIAETGGVAICPSLLWSEALTPGLPSEFVPAISRGIASVAVTPGGVLTIDRAAYSYSDSSEVAFERAGELLGAMLSGLTRSDFELENELRDRMRAWR